MNKEEYLSIVKKYTPKENKIKNYFYAFLVGGLIGFSGELIKKIIICLFHISAKDASSWTSLLVILITCICTGLGFFDNLVSKYKSGLFIPTTGFAHSIMSSSLDYKKDGLITGLGSNIFKLAGSVILYGLISAFIMGIIKVIINV